MDNTSIYKAVSEIGEEYLAASEDTAGIKKAFRRERRTAVWVVASACACLIITAGSILIKAQWETGTQGLPVPDPNGYIVREEEPENYPEPVILKPGDEGYIEPMMPIRTYSELTVGGHGIQMIKGSGTADIVAFSRKVLENASLIVEGTVLETHTKKYRYTVETDGKFEQAGRRVTYVTETAILTLSVERVWKGNGEVSAGDVLTVENERLYLFDYYGFVPGSTYVVGLAERTGDDTLLYSGINTGDVLVDGDITRETPYLVSYPYQPAIEKTIDGNYIVPVTWSDIAHPDDTNVLVTENDAQGIDLVWYEQFGLKLVGKEQFETRMKELMEDLDSFRQDIEEIRDKVENDNG